MRYADLFRIKMESISIKIVPPPVPAPLNIPEINPVKIFNIEYISLKLFSVSISPNEETSILLVSTNESFL